MTSSSHMESLIDKLIEEKTKLRQQMEESSSRIDSMIELVRAHIKPVQKRDSTTDTGLDQSVTDAEIKHEEGKLKLSIRRLDQKYGVRFDDFNHVDCDCEECIPNNGAAKRDNRDIQVEDGGNGPTMVHRQMEVDRTSGALIVPNNTNLPKRNAIRRRSTATVVSGNGGSTDNRSQVSGYSGRVTSSTYTSQVSQVLATSPQRSTQTDNAASKTSSTAPTAMPVARVCVRPAYKMAKRLSSSGSTPAAKRAKVAMAVASKNPLPTSSGNENRNQQQMASSSGTKQAISSSKASTSKASNPKRALTVAQLKELERLQKKAYDPKRKTYIVERILDKNITMEGVTKYKVKWLHYSDDECTWEEVHILADSMKRVLEWERGQGQNWQLKPFKSPHDDLKRNHGINDEHERLTSGEYLITEKYGTANGQTWYRMKPDEGPEQVLCLKDNDPYYENLICGENDYVTSPGVWDNVSE